MIARGWHGRVPTSKADADSTFLKQRWLHEDTDTPGNRGLFVFRREENGVTHFLLTTLGDSHDAIRRFVGDDFDRACYDPGDDSFLFEREPLVTHDEVLHGDARL
jgi:hypothetical protein